MTDRIDLSIRSTYDASGARAALSDAQALSKAQPRGGGGAAATQAQAQGMAQLSQATTQASAAQQRYAAAVGGAATASTHGATEVQRLALAQDRAAQAAQRSNQSLTALPRTLDSISGSALSTIQTLTGIGGAMAVLAKGKELARLGAQAGLVEQRFEGMAEAAGTSGDALLGALRIASGGEINDLNLQLAANKAVMLGVADSADEFGTLMAIARDRAQALGTDSTTAFNDLVTGLGRGSALILDNLGILVDADSANKAYAASVGKTAASLTEAERKQALINQVIAQGNATLAATGGAVDGASSSFAQLGAASDNAQAAVGKLVATLLDVPAQVTTEILVNVAGGINQIADANDQLKQIAATTIEVSETYEEYGQKQAFVNQQLADSFGKLGPQQATLTEAQYEYARSLIDSGQSAGQAYTAVQELAVAIEAGAQASTGWGEASNELRDTLIDLSGTSDYNRVAVASLSEQYISGGITGETFRASIAALSEQQARAAEMAAYETLETQRLTGAHIQVADAAGEAAAQSLIDAAAKEEDAAKTALLTLQTEAAVAEFLRLNPTLSDTQLAAAGAAAGLSPLQIQLAQTTIRANEAQNALSAFQRQAAIGAGVGGLTPNRGLVERGPIGGALGGGAGSSAAGQAFRTRAAINAAFPTRPTPVRGGGGGGGAAARVSESERAGEQLAQIEQRTQDQLAAIDERGAERRAAAFRKLNEDIATSSADLVASQEANDLDLIGASDEQMGKLAAREQAEAKARIKNAEAVAEAQKMAAEGNAEQAQEVLDIRQQAISKQQSLDERYAERQAELAGNDEATAALKREYDEATAAAAEAENVRLMLVQAAAAQRVAEVDEEKARVIAAAQEQAAGVKGATEAQRSAVVGSLDAQGAAFAGWAQAADRAADQVVAAAERSAKAIQSIPAPSAESAGGTAEGGGGPSAGGGAMLAGGGRASFGGGRAASGGGNAIATLAEANAVLEQILALGNVAKKYIKPIELYRQTLGVAVELLTSVADFHTAAQAAATSPISPALVQQLVDEARWVLDLTRHALVPTNERQVEIFERYASTVQSSIGVLSDMAGLRQAVSEALRNSSPFDVVAVNWLARRAMEFTALVLSQLLPTTEAQAAAMERYATGVGAAVDIIGGLAGLRQTVTEAMKDSAPFDSVQIKFLVGRAKEFSTLVSQQLVPTTEATAAGFDAYATAVGASVSIIGGIATLRQVVTEAMAESQPFDSKQIAFLVGRAKEFTALVRDHLVPTTEEQSEEVQRYADAVNASAQALKAPLELSGDLFADYVSPSDAQLDMVANDARRFVDRLAQAASTYSKEGLEASKAYAEGIGATFTAAKDGLLFFDALRSGDFTPQPAALAQFEAGTLALMDTAARLGKRAATIPAGDIAALGSITTVLNDQAAMLINMSAVPFGNLGAISGGYSGQQASAAGTQQTINVYIQNPPMGMDVNAVVRQVKEGLRQETTMRRS